MSHHERPPGDALADIDVAVLAGGLGTRIRGVLGDVPKILAPVGGRPFLEHLLDWLAGFGARRVVLCLGHGAGHVAEHLRTPPPAGAAAGRPLIVPVVEPAPLGTAGALRFARRSLTTDPVFVLNGDTFLDADIPGFVGRHRRAGAALSLLCARVPSVARYGSLELDAAGFVRRFVEKDAARDRPGLISAGMYLFSAAALDGVADGSGSSLERDVLERQPAGAIRAEVATGRFIDIGTPESLALAPAIIVSPAGSR